MNFATAKHRVVISFKKTKKRKGNVKRGRSDGKKTLGIKSKHSVSPKSQFPDLITYSVRAISRSLLWPHLHSRFCCSQSVHDDVPCQTFTSIFEYFRLQTQILNRKGLTFIDQKIVNLLLTVMTNVNAVVWFTEMKYTYL